MGIGEPDELGEINLARAAPLRIGRLTVTPATRQADWGQGGVTLEPRVIQVLIALAERCGQVVSRDELIARCWKGQVVGDNAIQRAISQLRRLSQDVGEPGFGIETIARVGYRLSAPGFDAVAGTPGAELAPSPRGAIRRPPPRFAIAAVILLILAVGAAVIWRVAPHRPTRPPGQNSRVDVVMVAPPGADPATQKTAADFSATVVRVLAGVGVAVTQGAAPHDDPAGAPELRIAGTVGQEGSSYVFSSQIIDRRSGAVLWSTRLVRSAQAQAASPGAPAYVVAAVLHCAISDRDRSPAALSTEAFGLYLNACAGVFDHTSGPARMLGATRRLVLAAPDFAGGHAMHALAAALAAAQVQHSPTEAAALHAESGAAAQRALKLDPNTPKAYAGLALNAGALSDRPDQDWLLEERYIRQALKLDPDLPPARTEYAVLLRSVGRNGEAVDFIRATDAMDPRNGIDPRLAMLLAARGDLAGAEAALTQIETATRGSLDSIRWANAVWWEDPKTALPKVRSLAPKDSPKDDLDCLVGYLTDLDARRAARTRGLPPSCGGMDPGWRMRLLAREGDVDGAFAALDHARNLPPFVLYYPEMRSVRADPRFWPLAARFGLPDYWRKSGHWPDFCAEPNLPYDCKVEAARLPKPSQS